MFELPEFTNLAVQINQTLKGMSIQQGRLGNTPHKFVWYNRTPEEFEQLTTGRVIGQAQAKGKWLFIPLEPGYVLLVGECGGKFIYHHPGSKLPKKYHLLITFQDSSFLTATTQMWGAYELYETGKELEREYVKDMRTTPLNPEFTLHYFEGLIKDLVGGKKRSVKSLLTQDQLIPGLGNAITQDILFRSRLHPRYTLSDLSSEQVGALYKAIQNTVQEVIAGGGRYDEFDLFNQRGRYVRVMDKNALDRPCPECAGKITKLAYLGGTCYLCTTCQQE
jgi:formamidopyrimidine-DNA glycosylase